MLFAATPVAASHNQYNPVQKWVVRNDSGYTYHIPVCPPWESAAWNLTDNMHARVNDAMGEWNEGGGELYYYRTNTSCGTLDSNKTPHTEVTWDSATGWNITGGQHQPCFDSNFIFCSNAGSPPVEYRSFIILDADMASVWYWGSGSPPANRVDVESALTHEYGHALMVMHFSGTACAGGNNLVMCDFLGAGQERDEVWPGYLHDQDNYTDIYGSTH
jgi:hypothetical protein